MENSVFFYRMRGKKEVLQELQWKSLSDANSSKKDDLLKLFAKGKYVSIVTFMPISMTKGETK